MRAAAPPPAVVDLPATFAAPGGMPTDTAGEVLDRWWTRFDDPRLTELVESAMSSSPAIGQALAQLDQARARASLVGADRLPQVNATFTAARQKQTLAGLGALGGLAGGGSEADDDPTAFITNNFGLSLEVGWEPDLWGRLRLQTAATRAEFLASGENLRAVRQSVAARTARTYLALVAAERQVALSERVVESFGEVARQAGNRARVGIAPPNDAQLATANVESARAGLVQRRESTMRQASQLAVLLRRYPDVAVAVADALPAVPPEPPAGLPAALLARRPDVVAAELRLRASGLRVDAARRALLPRISLTGSSGTASSALADLLDGSFGVWSIAGQVLQPIFQGGRLRAQVRVNDAERRESLEFYAETVLQALAEVETALAVEANLQASEAAYAAAAAAAERAITVSFNRYRAGIDPLLNVLESERRWLDARSAEIAARLARIENRIDLHLALGGGFGEALETAARVESR